MPPARKGNCTSGAGPSFPVPGRRTLENLLRTALLPLGTTMYVWGGGWDEEDTGAGAEARSIGLSPARKAFADAQTCNYDFRTTRYQLRHGLDCSGYVGWVVYNTMNCKNGLEGYVYPSTQMARIYASRGWGTYTPAQSVTDWLAGDIMSMMGHVWICLGTCRDGSVLMIHSTPPGVGIWGTSPENPLSDAARLAGSYMAACYPTWYCRYPECRKSTDYLKQSGAFRWSTDTFPDAEQCRSLSPRELLEKIG